MDLCCKIFVFLFYAILKYLFILVVFCKRSGGEKFKDTRETGSEQRTFGCCLRTTTTVVVEMVRRLTGCCCSVLLSDVGSSVKKQIKVVFVTCKENETSPCVFMRCDHWIAVACVVKSMMFVFARGYDSKGLFMKIRFGRERGMRQCGAIKV